MRFSPRRESNVHFFTKFVFSLIWGSILEGPRPYFEASGRSRDTNLMSLWLASGGSGFGVNSGNSQDPGNTAN